MHNTILKINVDKILENDKKNKAVYTAALVADGWAGAENLEK